MKKKLPAPNDTTLKRYLREISAYPLLTRKEELRLGRRIQSGDTRALEEMINANLRLVVHIAIEFTNIGLDLPDLIAEGNTGLMVAAERFDPERGSKFSTYASLWIKQRIHRALNKHSRTIRLPTRVIAESAQLARADGSLTGDLERAPTTRELAIETGMTNRKITRLRTLPKAVTSLDAELPNCDDLSLAEVIADEGAPSPEDGVAERWLFDELALAMPVLTARERVIIERRFGLDGEEPALLATLGERFGITRERVRQIQNASIEKLRAHMSHLHRYGPYEAEPAEALAS